MRSGGGAERRRRLLCFPWPDGPAGEGEAARDEARGGHERVGDGGEPGPWPAARAPASPGSNRGCAGPCRRVEGLREVGVRPPQGGRTCGGAQVCPLLYRTGKAPLLGAALSGLLSALGPFATCSRPASFRFPLCSSDPIYAQWAGAATPRGAQNSGSRGQRLSSTREEV